MPQTVSSIEFEKGYRHISQLCHEHDEPIFISNDGRGDLAIMSMETYDAINSKMELYNALFKGLSDVKNGQYQDAKLALTSIKSKLGNL